MGKQFRDHCQYCGVTLPHAARECRKRLFDRVSDLEMELVSNSKDSLREILREEGRADERADVIRYLVERDERLAMDILNGKHKPKDGD